jgi:hypothetical protein
LSVNTLVVVHVALRRGILVPLPCRCLPLSAADAGLGYLFSFFFPRPGLAPAGDLLSFASPKERKQRKGDPAVCDPTLRFGQPAVLTFRGVSPKLASLKQGRALIRETLRSSAHTEGLWGPTRHRCARQGNTTANARQTRKACLPLGPSEAMARSVPKPLWLRRGAQRFADQGSQLFERSEFCETPRNASTAGCPVAKRRGRRQWGRLFFAYVLLAKQKKVSRLPGRDPASERKLDQCVRNPAVLFSPRAKASSSTAIPSARIPAGICEAAMDESRSRKNGHG